MISLNLKRTRVITLLVVSTLGQLRSPAPSPKQQGANSALVPARRPLCRKSQHAE